ncbi:MAG: asparagine synthase (glutamine-hydrolyzing) [Bacteroidetes bacterium]|nr:MAG: asparagine synthase (glutamine-hydrolyzing) [Bacteroidota bacterium]
MCGISGIFQATRPLVRADTIRAMLTRIQYRGPDESGIYIGEHVGLGSVRLSIIDLAHGQQPMSTPDGRYWIAYNGEVFNYLELRAELESLGHAFRTNSDTEVLLRLFVQYGEACLGKLNGQFAFAVWDSEEKELFLARDRMGIRPLFYADTEEGLVFASEIKCIFASGAVEAELDPEALNAVFTFWSVPTPGSVFKGIRELSPGHFLKVNASGIRMEAYWELSYDEAMDEPTPGGLNRLQEELDFLLQDAVRLRLRSDVQVAAYLSGGIDSGATTHFVKQIEPGLLNTFSIGFEDAEFDETDYQREVARWLDTHHSSIACRTEDVAGHFQQVVWHAETPLLRTAAVPMFMLSGLVQDSGIKVVITGEGADEFLGGYNIFKEALIREFWAKQPDSKIRPLLLQRLYPYLAQFQGRSARTLKFFFGHGLTELDNPVYSHMIRWNNSKHIKEHFSEQLRARAGRDPVGILKERLPGSFQTWDLLDRAQWLESRLFLSGYLLSSQGDRMSMAHSVEGRYPFLDHRFIDFATRIPQKYRIRGLNEKYLLKKLMSRRLPEKVLKRPKQAYRAPVASSLLSDQAPALLREMLSAGSIQKYGLFNPLTVEKLVNKMQQSGRATENENMAVAGILSTQILMEQFVHGNCRFRADEMKVPCKVIYDKRLKTTDND